MSHLLALRSWRQLSVASGELKASFSATDVRRAGAELLAVGDAPGFGTGLGHSYRL